jgi:predicted ATP-grasp superfamily ATP-dependent carboligase
MREALVADLEAIPGVEVWVTTDPRFPESVGACRHAVPLTAGDFDRALTEALARVDAVWLVAPETGGVLERLTRHAEATRCALLGAGSAAVRVLTSKRETAALCALAGIACVPCVDGRVPFEDERRWVVKPDDGCGCLDTFVFEEFDDAWKAWQCDTAGLVLQPFVEGEPASLSIVTDGRDTRVLSVNRQHVVEVAGQLRFDGVSVAVFDDPDGALADMACRVVRAVPGLRGFFGIDLVFASAGPLLLEVNPRPTTAYAGLRERTGVNPAQWILTRRTRIERSLA